jgi:homoprotocatechuate degradation regulator HpaR
MATQASFRHRNLPLLMLQAREAIISRFRPLLNSAGITEQQWRVIRALLEKGPLEPREIGQICQFSSPSLAGILARMDEMALIQRERFSHDQRRVKVSVAEKGMRLAAQLSPQIEAVYEELELQLGQGFVERLYASLDDLMARAERNSE